MRLQIVPKYRCYTRQFPPDLRSDNEVQTMKSDLRKSEKIRGENTKLKNKRPEKSKSEDLWSDSCGARRLRG